MARKTIEQQEIIRQAFITKLQKKKSEPFFQCSVFLSGAAKNKFIDDIINNQLKMNKQLNVIVKYYYDNNQKK